MNTKLINHEKYWLFVEIRENYRISPDEWYVRDYKGIQLVKATSSGFGTWEIIIAYLPKDNAPILEGVALLPSFERGITITKQGENVEELAEVNANSVWNDKSSLEWMIRKDAFIDGYKAASKNKWSSELLRRLKGWKEVAEEKKAPNTKTPENAITTSLSEGAILAFERVEQFLQSLSPVTLPIDFKPKYENFDLDIASGDAVPVTLPDKTIIKTIKNEAGIDVLQGEWIYQQ